MALSDAMDPIRVLLVDDEIDFAEALAMRLEAAGYDARAVDSGADALELLATTDMDVVLLDLVMPGLSGIDVLRRIKDDWPLIEVLLLTGKGAEKEAIEAMRRGAYDFLVKPPEFEGVKARIEGAFVRVQKQRERIAKAQEASGIGAQVEATEEAGAEDGVREGRETGRLLAVSTQAEFSGQLIDYALDMAQRISAEVIALNAAGIATDTFDAFPTAKQRVLADYQSLCKESIGEFRRQADEREIPFHHIVKPNDVAEAIHEIQAEIGQVDFVLSTSTDDAMIESSKPTILVYSPT